MQKQLQRTLLVLCFCGLSACSAPSDVPNATQKPKDAHQQGTHIYTEQFKALEKSKNLARNRHQAELTRQKQMEELTR